MSRAMVALPMVGLAMIPCLVVMVQTICRVVTATTPLLAVPVPTIFMVVPAMICLI